MQKAIALTLGVLVSLLGLAGVGYAQSGVQVQGTIQGVDCQSGTVAVATSDSTNTIAVAPYTAVLVDSRAVPLCDLRQYVGSPVTIWVIPEGNQFVATRIDTTAQAAVSPVALPAQQEAISPLPIIGIVLGTILLAGLIYLLVRDHDRYYRYPYYGEYYRYYYRPEYRVYGGPVPYGCPVVYAPVPVTGVVVGVTAFSGYDYLLVRDRDGRYERYPYYGPYRSYYYRPEYREYGGPYHDAPVHYGDTRGSVVWHHPDAPNNYHGPQQVPQYQQPYQHPNYAPVQYQRPNDNNHGPQQYQQPYQQPYNNYHAPQPYQQPYQRPGNDPQPVQNQHPNYAPVQYQRPNDNNHGPQPYQQPSQQPYNNSRPVHYQRPNDNNHGPQPYQQPYQQPYNNSRPAQYQRPNDNRGQSQYQRSTRQTCQSNGQGQSCSDNR